MLNTNKGKVFIKEESRNKYRNNTITKRSNITEIGLKYFENLPAYFFTIWRFYKIFFET